MNGGAARHHPDADDARERGIAHELVLDVGERLRGSDCDRVAGVHAHRIEVLDRADDHEVVGAVAHDLQLVLLPASDRSLDQDLADGAGHEPGSEEHTSELQSLMRISYAVFCLKKKNTK